MKESVELIGRYLPEGGLIGKRENEEYLSSAKMLERAMRESVILEAVATSCFGDDLSLTVDLGGGLRGVMPRNEVSYEVNGAEPKDITVVTRVGRPICFVVTDVVSSDGGVIAYLSRRRAQIKCRAGYISKLTPGDVIDGTVTHLDPFGAFVDIGCGVVSLLSVDCISVSRISHPSQRLKKGERLKVVVKSVDPESGRIYVTLRELLGTWEENAAEFKIGSAVAGIVRCVEDYGIFIELSPNLAGLAERRSGIEAGDACSVYIKNMIRERMKVKLSIIDSYAPTNDVAPVKYFVDTEKIRRIDRWRYSPLVCPKVIETIFN